MYKVQQATFLSPLYHAAVALRYRVLREPLGLQYTQEQLEAEADQWHLVATDEQDQVVGVLLLQHEDDVSMKMRQVAVLPELQRQGIGRLLVDAAEQLATSRHYRKITLHARVGAIPFYESLGYIKTGDEFAEVGIPHYKMYKYVSFRD